MDHPPASVNDVVGPGSSRPAAVHDDGVAPPIR